MYDESSNFYLSVYESRELSDIANKLRISAILATNNAKSGHPTSCSSIAEILAVLFFKIMRYRINKPKDPANDRLILSKGCAAPILYAAWAEVGLFPKEKLLSLRKLYSTLEGHPNPRLPFIDVCTGSLGHGLAVAAGMAFVAKKLLKEEYRTYCIIGDSECSEGSIWEAFNFASHYKLDNLCIIIDVNRLGQCGQTPLGHDTDVYCRRMVAFGIHAIVIDGHSVEELVRAFAKAEDHKGKPTAIIARTLKGKNFLTLQNAENWHGKVLGDKADKIIEYIESLIANRNPTMLRPSEPSYESIPDPKANVGNKLSTPPFYRTTDMVSTREAFGTALIKLAQDTTKIISFDADCRNATYSELLRNYDQNRLIQCFAAEQNLVGVALGVTCRSDYIGYIATYAAFLTRAFDQIRMSALSRCNMNFCGTHCGVSAGADGPCAMGLEDLAMFRSIPESIIFYPSDAIACERACEIAANITEVVYIRLTRPKTPIIYPNNKAFRLGEANILKQHQDDQLLIISAGITLVEALDAAIMLEKENIYVRVMDLFTVQPIDQYCIKRNARETYGKIITVEDHYPQGGIGEAILSVLAEEPNIVLKKLAISTIPSSGSSAELLDYFGVSASNIYLVVKEFLKIQ